MSCDVPVIHARPEISGTTAGRPATSVSSTMRQTNSEPMIERPVKRCPTASCPRAWSTAMRAEQPVPVGSEFVCRIVEEANVAGRPAVVPEISGRAWITGTSQLLCDPADPWPEGYRLSDTWPALAPVTEPTQRAWVTS